MLLICLLIFAIGSFFHNVIFAVDKIIKSNIASLFIVSSLYAIFISIETFVACIFIAQAIKRTDFDKI